jgi:hypothetical protein
VDERDAADRPVVCLVRGDERLVLGPVPSGCADLRLVDDLLRLHLAGRRFGWSVRLSDAGRELADLLAFVGLADVLPP